MTDQSSADDSGGAYQSSFTVSHMGTADEIDALIRARHGDEAADRIRRTRELMANPRPLTPEERETLDAAMDPVLADLRAAGAIVPEVRYQAWSDEEPDYVHAFIASPALSPADRPVGANGVRLSRRDPARERIAELADQVQDWEVEALAAAGRPATWPECPEHPASHPLQPWGDGPERAVWRCPRSRRAVSAIGELGGSRGA